MKIKTMLRFLLCFLIITIFCVTLYTCNAVPSAEDFFDAGSKMSFDYAPLLHIQSLVMLFGKLLAVIVVLVYGIQWVTATSSRRQELKAGLWPLVIGIILLVIGPKLAVGIYNSLSVSGSALDEDAKSIAKIVISVVRTIGYVVSTVMILVVGVQWTTSNPNKRQELKSRMVNIIIGAILIVGGVTILGLVAEVADDTKSSVKTAADFEISDRHCYTELNICKKL